MRNLKKLLSLLMVFALVLGLGMTAFAVESADNTKLTDWEEIEHKEAAQLLGVLGVMKGNANGTFNPDGVLTRGEAMALISRALWKGDDQSNLYKASNPGGFRDIAADGWSQGYISYGFVMGFISGNGDGTVTPLANVTGAAFLKMILCALGVDAARYTNAGSGWEAVVIADAVRLGLVDGISGFDHSAGLIRDNAAQIVFNMMTTNIQNDNATDKLFVTDTSDWEYRSVEVKDADGNSLTPKQYQVVGGWVNSSSNLPKTFGAENFGYTKVVGALVAYEWGSIYAGAEEALGTKEFAWANDVEANGDKYVDGLLRVYTGKDNSYDDKYTTHDLVWNDVTGDIGPEMLGETFEVVKIGNDILSWRHVGSTEVKYNADDKGKTINADLLYGRYINNAPSVGASVLDNTSLLFVNTNPSPEPISKADTVVAADWTFVRQALINLAEVESDDPLVVALDDAVTDWDAQNFITAPVPYLANIGDAINALSGAASGNPNLAIAAAKSEAQRLKNIAFANDTFAQKGNVTKFFDYNADGKADVMLVTAYAYDIVKDLNASKAIFAGDDKAPCIQWTKLAANSGWVYADQVETENALAKNDRVVYIHYPLNDYFVIDSVLPLETGKIGTVYSNGTFAFDGVTMAGTAGFGNVSITAKSKAGTEGGFYFWNNLLVDAEIEDDPDNTIAVVYGVYAYYSAASAMGGENRVDLRVLAALEDGTIGQFNVAKVGGKTPSELVKDIRAGAPSATSADISEALAKKVLPSLVGFDENVYICNGDTKNEFEVYTYLLSADGKSLTLATESLDTVPSQTNDYEGNNFFQITGGDELIVNSSTVAFIQNDEGAFAVYKGINKIPSLDFSTANAAIQYMAVDALGTGDGLGYLVVPHTENLIDTSVSGAIFAVVAGYDTLGGGFYGFNMFDGTANPKYYSTENNSNPVGFVFNKVSINDNVVTFSGTPLNTEANVGYISGYKDGTYAFVNLATGTAQNIAYGSETKYYLIDGTDSVTLSAAEAAELLPQDEPEEGYVVLVTDSGKTVVIFAEAQTEIYTAS